MSKKSNITEPIRKQPTKFSKKHWVGIGLIALVSIVIYYNSLNAPFIFDSIYKIVQNPDIRELNNIKTKLIYRYDKAHKTPNRNDPSRPLTYLTFTLNYHFGQLNTFGYHLFNILIHIFNSILIFLLTKKILFYTYKEATDIFPLFVALLFAAHPVNTNVVTYIFARSGSLATMFYFLSLLFFIKTFEGKKRVYIFSLLFCVLSFLSKPIAVTFPAIVLIFDYIFLADYKIQRIIEKKYYHIPFWAILIGYLLFRYFYLGGIGDIETNVSTEISRSAYLITQTNIIVRYLKLLIIPIGFSIDHSINLAKTIFEFRILLPIFLIAGMFLLTWRSYKKKTGWSKINIFCVLWFFITLSPTSSFFPTTSYMDEKRMYLSGFGVYLPIVLLYFWVFCRGITCSKKSKQILLCLMAVHISFLGITTWKRNNLYNKPLYLWQDAVSKYPTNARAHANLGFLYQKQKEYSKAIREYNKALEINPKYSEVYNHLGVIYYINKDYRRAIQEFKKEIEINPENAKTHNKLASLHYYLNEYDKAIQEYQKAVKINPNYTEAHKNLGFLYQKRGEYNKAIREYNKVLEMKPKYPEVHNHLGAIYYANKDFNMAIQEYEKAIELNPNYAEAYNGLGAVFFAIEEYENAIWHCKKAIELNPSYVDAYNNLGILLYHKKEYRKALEVFKTALKLASDTKLIEKQIEIIEQFLLEEH